MQHDFREQVTRFDPGGLESKDLREFLQGIQGNILKHHGRGYSVHVLITFRKESIPKALQWIAAFEPTSAWAECSAPPDVFRMLALTRAGYDILGIAPKDQPRDAAFRRGMRDGSAAHPAAAYPFAPQEAHDPMRDVHAIAIIATDKHELIKDDGWKARLAAARGSKVDIDDICTWRAEFGHLIWTDGKGHYKYGRKLKDQSGYYIEHFGYHDGISNPQFLKPDPAEGERTGRRARAANGGWNDFAPLNVVLSDEPPRSRYLSNAYGSYLVFQKLEQNVPGFLRSARMLALQFAVDETADRLAADLSYSQSAGDVKRRGAWDASFHPFIQAFDDDLQKLSRLGLAYDRRSYAPDYAGKLKDNSEFRDVVHRTHRPGALDIERAGAMVIGRYRNGTPVFAGVAALDDTLVPTPLGHANDFEYGTADAKGLACPFHAHTRRMNPRGELSRLGCGRAEPDPRQQSPQVERTYCIARRGVPYGSVDSAALAKRNEYQEDDFAPYGGAHADPASRPGEDRGVLFMSFQADLENYEILADSANDRNFIAPASTRLQGIDPVIGRESVRFRQDWPRPPKGERATRFLFRDYVVSRGGAYFFAPSLEFLRTIREISTHARAGRK